MADLIGWLKQRVTEPAHIFGHSLGGIVALMIAAQAPASVRSVVVGDAPLSSATWQAVLNADRERLIALRSLAGGTIPLDQISEALKNALLMLPGRPTPIKMREALGEESPYFAWMTLNLFQHDPSMLTAILDNFAVVAVGYEMETLLPKIDCPVLLLQADPATGGILTDDEVRRALPLLKQPHHIQLHGGQPCAAQRAASTSAQRDSCVSERTLIPMRSL